jgi:hypothetical protein
MSGFGQGQAVTSVISSSYMGVVDFGAGLPEISILLFSLYFCK